jgi:hypothetical protein
MSSEFEPLDSEEVLSFEIERNRNLSIFNLPLTFTIDELFSNIKSFIINASGIYRQKSEKILNDGLEGKALRFGAKGWQKGKVRVRLVIEFCPDEPETEEITKDEHSSSKPSESPLDDLRQMVNDN